MARKRASKAASPVASTPPKPAKTPPKNSPPTTTSAWLLRFGAAAAIAAAATLVPGTGTSTPVAQCGADAPAQWLHRRDATLLSSFDAAHNASLLWGTYRPSVYFGVRSRTAPEAVVAGLLWTTPGGKGQLRHDATEGDGLRAWGWSEHDGRGYGRQALPDAALGLEVTTAFVKPEGRPDVKWAAQVAAAPAAGAAAAASKATMYFYLAVDCDGVADGPLQCAAAAGAGDGLRVDADAGPAAVRVAGRTAALGAFALTVAPSPGSGPVKLSYQGFAGTLAADVAGELGNSASAAWPPRLGGTSAAHAHLVVVGVTCAALPCAFDAVLRDASPAVDEFALGPELERAAARFGDAFEAAWQPAAWRGVPSRPHRVTADAVKQDTKAVPLALADDPDALAMAKFAMSNMLGGMGYFHGASKVKARSGDGGADLDSFPVSLFTCVPSRAFFPRGFLWDEGFHQLLVSRWDPRLTLDVLGHWFGALHVHRPDPTTGGGAACPGAWLPREQILGETSRRRVPAEFMAQDVAVANPPALFLTIEALLDGLEDAEKGGANADADATRVALTALYPSLRSWLEWLMASQAGPTGVRSSFQWRGRDANDGKLVPNTLASGLDDYPRATVPSADEHHADLAAWMAFSNGVLARVARVAGDTRGRVAHEKAAAEIFGRLDDLHWSEAHGGYLDVGLHAANGRFETQVVVRCGSADRATIRDVGVPHAALSDPNHFQKGGPCPADAPVYMFPLGNGRGGYAQREVFAPSAPPALQHVAHLGYASVFPLALRLLPADSPRLGRLLALVSDRKTLWSPHGLRSLSKADRFYGKENAPGDAPYWRGAVWVPINYLALRGLKHYGEAEGPYRGRAADLYEALRGNLVRTILAEWKRTGTLWEHYDDRTGNGMRSSPFTGWTALVLKVLAEV